jgi:prolyl oligopeptidase
VERGGVFVQANLRGGGEYGKDWHEAGTLERKQNVFDDFIACAEHLIRTGVTAPAHLGIHGRSNGGLLVGACMTQRPDLFGAAIPQVGVLDMLRYHQFTIGWAWASDYGRSDDPAMLGHLLAYSPLHALKAAAYPPTLIVTGDHDDRVVPGHSFKFGAQLQYVQQGHSPTLLRLETRGGHGAGKPTALLIDEWADILAFLEHHLR